MTLTRDITAVVIGRNEGQRLVVGLKALQGKVARIIYVDSGSTDGSVAAAQQAGAEIVPLDTSIPFTAARARNAGVARMYQSGTATSFIQFLDGDCEIQPGWLETAQAFLQAHPDCAVVCGRRRERFPDETLYNWLIDQEWDTPVGPAKYCGGDALMRSSALQAAGGYNPDLIAGEEPELCVRLRQAGWSIWRLDAEMTWHDAALHRFSQWWRRAQRAGFAFAEGAALHGKLPERHFVTETRRALLWGAALPALIALACLVFGPWALLAGLVWPLQALRLRLLHTQPWSTATFLTLAKFPEAQGALQYLWRRITNGTASIIEYK